MMAESNSGNKTGKPTQKQNDPGTASRDSPDNEKETNDEEMSIELLQEGDTEEVITNKGLYKI